MTAPVWRWEIAAEPADNPTSQRRRRLLCGEELIVEYNKMEGIWPPDLDRMLDKIVASMNRIDSDPALERVLRGRSHQRGEL